MRYAAIVGTGLLLIVGSASAASAADLAAAPYTKAPAMVDPAYNWSGFYLGIEGGGAWAQSQQFRNDPLTPTVNGLPTTAKITADGGLVGGTLGYNYQFASHVVVGFETDISWISNKETGNIVPPFTPTTDVFTTSQSWFYTARGRLGYAWDRWLVFGTGGVAFTNENIQLCGIAVGCGSQSQIVAGWTAGGGVEYAFAGNWTAKLEYLHADFGSQHFLQTPVAATAFRARDVTLTNDIVRAGINYKFGWDGPVVAKY